MYLPEFGAKSMVIPSTTCHPRLCVVCFTFIRHFLSDSQVNNAGRILPEDGAVSGKRNLLPALDAQHASSVRGPYILVHELLDFLVRNKGTSHIS